MKSAATMISVWVSGTPRHQPRPRAFARKMPNGQYIARVYDDGSAEGWKAAIACSLRSVPWTAIEGPVCLTLQFYFPRPKGHYRTGKNATTLKPGAPIMHCARPDVDNTVKCVMDCLTKLGVWRDDNQVAILSASKMWSNDPTRVGAQINVEEIAMNVNPTDEPTQPEQPALFAVEK